MASIFFKRLAEKYGTQNITGKKYQQVITDILANNNQKISNAVNRITSDNYKKDLKRITQTKAKTIKLPNISEVLPKQSVFLIKGADSGEMISQTLRSELERNLRQTLKEFDGTGESRMEIQRGRTTGKINTDLIKRFQEEITETFQSRTKKDPKTGVPGNVRNIAVTETRSTIDSIKETYTKELLRKNPQLEAVKTWLHNKRLSKVPRKSHMNMDKITIPMNQKFVVEREDKTGYDFMERPHDPTAPPEQVIGCSCDIVYKTRFKE